MSTILGDHAVAAGDDVELAPEHVLGHGVTFSNPDDERPLGDFLRSWDARGLDVNDLPEARHPVHVFQSACAKVRQRRHAVGGQHIEIRSDDLRLPGNVCAYQITVVEWDQAERVIEHEKAMRVEFDKTSQEITVEPLDGFTPRLAKLEDVIRQHFKANERTIPGNKIRNAVRDQLLRIGAQNLRRRSGGLYFVSHDYAGAHRTRVTTMPVLDGLKGVLADMYGERGDFYTWSYFNNEGVRSMVRKHFTINAAANAEELAAKAVQRVRTGKGARGVNPELVTNLQNERRKLLASVEQYRDLVGLEQTALAANLSDLDSALTQLEELAEL